MEAAEALAAAAACALRSPTGGASPGRPRTCRSPWSDSGRRGPGRRCVDARCKAPPPVPTSSLLPGAGRVRHGGLPQVLGLRSLAAIPSHPMTGRSAWCCAAIPSHAATAGRSTGPPRTADRRDTSWSTTTRLGQAGRHEASPDPPTGRLDRPAFDDPAGVARDRTVSAGGALTVPVAGLDRFAEVGEQPGHLVGDDLLIERAARSWAVVGGGDQLVPWFRPETDLVTREMAVGAAAGRCAYRRSPPYGSGLGAATPRSGRVGSGRVASLPTRLAPLACS